MKRIVFLLVCALTITFILTGCETVSGWHTEIISKISELKKVFEASKTSKTTETTTESTAIVQTDK